MYDSEQEYLVSDKAFDGLPIQPPLPLQQRRLRMIRNWSPIFCAHLTLVCVYTILSIATIRWKVSNCQHGPGLIYSPARQAVRYETVDFDSNDAPHAATAGRPSPALDAAWHDLLQYTNIRLSEEEMDMIDPERKAQSVRLPDGGYFATLTVNHELHCLKRVHQYMYPEYYFPELSKAELEDNRMHNEHCLDVIRRGIMCRGDITPITMRWGTFARIPLGNFSSLHECVAWGPLDKWNSKRYIPNLMEPGYLKHPKFGNVYEEGFENKVGIAHDNISGKLEGGV